MKEIKAIIQPFMLEAVMDALRRIDNLPGITVSDVRGFGRTRGRTGNEHDATVRYLKKTKIELVVHDALVELVLHAIQEHARTGNLGDGKIFVYTVDDVMRIRTGERGEDAI